MKSNRRTLVAIIGVAALLGAGWFNASRPQSSIDGDLVVPMSFEASRQDGNEGSGQDEPESGESESPTVDTAELEAARRAFAEKHSEWKNVIKEMLKIKLAYATCSPSEVDQLVLDWEKKNAQGEALIQELKTLGTDIFRDSEEVDRGLAVFLSNMVERDVQADRYDSAYQIGSLLLKHPLPGSKLWSYMGVACFATQRFDEAETWLKKAQEFGEMDTQAAKFLEEIEKYKETWPREQALIARDEQLNDLPRIKMETTKGDLIIELFEEEAPSTVANFVMLTDVGFYDGIIFHRVLPGFMAQTGCPLGTGYGNAGYYIPCECYEDEIRHHFSGYLAMAHSGQRNSGGSQFYITFAPAPHLDGKHTVFGRVIEGLDVLSELQRIDPENPEAAQLEPDKIIKATVIRKRDHEYEPIKILPGDEQ